MSANEETLLNAKELAKALNISPSVVYKWAQNAEFPNNTIWEFGGTRKFYYEKILKLGFGNYNSRKAMK